MTRRLRPRPAVPAAVLARGILELELWISEDARCGIGKRMRACRYGVSRATIWADKDAHWWGESWRAHANGVRGVGCIRQP